MPASLPNLAYFAFWLLAFGISTRSVHHGWSRRNICWFILLAYLYIQFESYAFYAIPLFIWAVCTIMNRGKTTSIPFRLRESQFATLYHADKECAYARCLIESATPVRLEIVRIAKRRGVAPWARCIRTCRKRNGMIRRYLPKRTPIAPITSGFLRTFGFRP